jgi:hypothetical protein
MLNVLSSIFTYGCRDEQRQEDVPATICNRWILNDRRSLFVPTPATRPAYSPLQ